MTMTELPRARTFLLADGKLHVRHCAACDRNYPAWMVICAGCGDTALPTRPVSGRGEVRSWVTYRRQYSLPFDLPVPYTVVLVELAEGVRVNGLWHAPTADGLARGTKVELAGNPAERPVFAPAGLGERETANLGALLAELAQRRGDTMAIGSSEGVVTYRELYSQARRVCGALRAAGVVPGDRVAMLGPNSPRYIAAIFGTFLAGAVSVGVSTWYTPDQIGYVLGHAEPKVLFTVSDFLGRDYVTEVGELPVAPVGYDLDDWSAIEATDEAEATLAPPDSAAYLLYTSGSTGPPKGVLLRHDGLIRNSTEAAAKLGIGQDDVAYVGVPLCFAYGCVQGLLTSFVHGAGVVIQRRFEPVEALDLVARFGCTTWFGVPSMVRRTVAVPGFGTDWPATVTKGRVGHAPDDIRFARDRFGMDNVCVGYGMTELYGPCALSDRDDDLESRIEGWCDVLASTDIRIVDPDTEQEVPPGEPGEIRAKSVFGYLAYFRDPERNAAQFDTDGYFRTGDQGVRRADGRLRFTGRYKNLIKTNGLNIAAEDIERGMLAQPAVVEACAFGIPHRTKEEAPVVVVVTDGPAVAAELLAWRASAFPSFQAPAVVVAARVLPKMSEQKIDRLRVAAACRAWLDRQGDLGAFLAGTGILAWDGVRDDD